MNKFLVLFSQSYLSKLKAKSFLITTLIMLLAIFAAFMWPTISSWLSSNNKAVKIVIVDQTRLNTAAFFKSDNHLKFKNFTGTLDQADQSVKKKKADGVLLLDQNASGQLTAQIRTADTALELNDQQQLDHYVQNVNQLFTIKQMNLTNEQAQRILSSHLTLDQHTMNTQQEGKSADSKTKATLISYGIAFLIYLFVLSYLSMISSEIAAEKDTRIMEIIISSSSPLIHLLSRVTGILSLAFTQIIVLAGAALIMAKTMNHGEYWNSVQSFFSNVSAAYFIYAILFFVLACVLYTLIGAVLGSLVNKVQDVGQAIMPVTFALMIGFFIAISGMNNPDTLLIKVSSYIPFISSMIMPMRIGATDMGLWEAAVSLILLAATIIWLFLFSLRFYKGSVLTYTSGSFLKKMKQALSLSK
ncbi:ABC transporter permease [Sporolactobacillus sp. Y61]|uniref:ABC transporter permease n=1 Tax=Sporolactobacillus sp. Y61 TaxID=3160863 RepID=A0AAU8IE56_9BACL